jgi:phage pi2 protein 07
MDSQKVSTAADFAEPETKLLELPRKGPLGKTLVVRIRAVPVDELLVALEGIPELQQAGTGDAAKDKSFNQARELILAQVLPKRRIAKAGIVEPVFVFGPDEAGAQWSNLHSENQEAIVNEIMEFSGLTGKGQAEKAEAFRGVAGQ